MSEVVKITPRLPSNSSGTTDRRAPPRLAFGLGWTDGDALRTLKAQQRAGNVTSRRVAYTQDAGLEWKCAAGKP
ncbi:hypothetical protein ACVIGB_000537 [Bradyrhizobium sp. USDA 4341]